MHLFPGRKFNLKLVTYSNYGYIEVTSQNKTIMDASENSDVQVKQLDRYLHRSDDDKQKLLNEKDRKSTQLATEAYLKRFKNYLVLKNKPNINAITPVELNQILVDYYCSVQPRKKDGYCVQSMKCMRAGLNRYFRKNIGIDITKDAEFVRANEMFAAVCVQAKKKGLGVKHSYPPITSIDLERIAEYFHNDYMNNPDPRRLQQTVIFNTIYFFCR